MPRAAKNRLIATANLISYDRPASNLRQVGAAFVALTISHYSVDKQQQQQQKLSHKLYLHIFCCYVHMVLRLIVATTILDTIIKSAYSTIIIFLVCILVLLALTHHCLLDAFLFATDVTVHRLRSITAFRLYDLVSELIIRRSPWRSRLQTWRRLLL